MATNDFLPFGVGTGANVITQPTYVGLTAVQQGFSSGIAAANQANKVWRQASIISSMIGQFIVDNTGQNAADDGTIATLETNLALAIQAVTRKKVVGANLQLYVNASGGLDTNNGLSPGFPFKTIQAAVNSAFHTYDFNGFNAIINIANGTYLAGAQITGVPVGCNAVTLIGNTATPAAVQINVSGANGIVAAGGAIVNLSGVTITATGISTLFVSQGYGILAVGGSQLTINGPTAVGNCAAAQIAASSAGTVIYTGTGLSLTGTSPVGLLGQFSSLLYFVGGSVSLFTPTYTNATVSAALNGVVDLQGVAFSGTATGIRYAVSTNSTVYTAGQAVTFIPGTGAGTVATGGVYA